MKRFISIFMSLTMIFVAFGAVNAEASTLQDMYYAYKYLIDSTAVEHKYDGFDSYYDLYDIDKDGSAELFIFVADHYTYHASSGDCLSNSLYVYTYKNGQAYLCGNLYAYVWWDCLNLYENRYGNGVGISGGDGGRYGFEFYVLNGTKLEYTGNICYTTWFEDQPYYYNDKIISDETVKTYFPERYCYNMNNINDLTYLKNYFKM